jgi:GTP pyrophosphokinase
MPLEFEDFIKQIGKTKENSNLTMIREAFYFARSAHRDQKRASGEMYFIHPIETAKTVASYGLDDEAITAALLHDVVDDTPITNKEIEQKFGKNVAFLVAGVTKLGKFKYRGVERQIENLRKMFLAMAEDIRVVLIKLADRLHNIKTLGALPPEKRQRIAMETLEIYAPIANRLGMGELKGKLEDICFPYAYPEKYKWLMDNIKDKYEASASYVKKIIPPIEEELKKNGIVPVEIQTRAKHYLSLYRKLERYDMNVEKIHDIVAVRIIVDTVEQCYGTLGILHNLFKPLPGRIKDYIALPKPNGYQSLQTTVICYGGKITEFQIRTAEMHKHAELGIASHWAYSEMGKPKQGSIMNEEKFSWVRQLQEWQKEIKGTAEFMESLKIDFFKERIFVFTPKGDVVDLPDGATPIDFAYHIHSQVGDHCAGAKVNGKMVSLNYTLHNGDVIEILTQKNKKPTSAWFSLAKTSYAKARVRRYIEKASPKIKKKYQFRIGVKHKVGMIKNISTVFAKEKISITDINLDSSHPKVGYVTVKFFHDNEKELELVANKLRRLADVLSCEIREV